MLLRILETGGFAPMSAQRRHSFVPEQGKKINEASAVLTSMENEEIMPLADF